MRPLKLSMLEKSLRYAVAGAGIAACLAVVGCASSATDPTVGWSPNKLYEEAKDQANSNAWDKAIALYEKLEGRAAGTPLAQQAELEKAYAQYRNGEQAQAVATLDRFIKLHPGSPALDYAYYLKGLVNFNDSLGFMGRYVSQDLAERDQKASKESFEAFKQLVERFPDSKYTTDAKERLVYLVGSLARYEVHVAQYYFSRGAYVAAINRAQTAISEYKEVPAVEDGLWILVQSYEKLGMKDLAADSRRVMQKSFPQSRYLADEANGSGKSWWKLW